MSNHDLTTGALTLLFRHNLTGCIQAGHQATGLLERLAETAALDRTTRELCQRMSDRLLDARGLEA
jgi:hypothetical protein